MALSRIVLLDGHEVVDTLSGWVAFGQVVAIVNSDVVSCKSSRGCLHFSLVYHDASKQLVLFGFPSLGAT